MIDKVKERVYELLCKDYSGHGIDHIERVVNLSLKFAQKENGNLEIVTLIALLHDVDDYKLFGEENANQLTNAKRILKEANVPEDIQMKVLSSLKYIGYSKRLRGLTPNTLEAKIVSDADMCDALGVSGLLRTYQYSTKNGKPFFDKNTFPKVHMNADEYTKHSSESSVCHIFEKILKLKDCMLTESGRKEAIERHQIVVDVLYHLFNEENAPEWTAYLNEYLITTK